MSLSPRQLDWAMAVAEGLLVIFSGVAVYRLLGAGDAAVAGFLIVSGAVAAIWVLLLNPWSRWALPLLTRSVVAAGLSVLTALALVMTGLLWWAALLVIGGVLFALVPVLRGRSDRSPVATTGRASRR